MGRRTEAPDNFACPYRLNCPHPEGMPTPCVLENYEEATELREQLHIMELRVKLQSSPVAHADETSWRDDGRGRYLWYGGNKALAVFQIADRSADSALWLLGHNFAGTLVSDAYPPG